MKQMLLQGQKDPRVFKIFVRISGAGNGCATFMGDWGGGILVSFGWGSADFIFMGAWIFFIGETM